MHALDEKHKYYIYLDLTSLMSLDMRLNVFFYISAYFSDYEYSHDSHLIFVVIPLT